MPRRNAMFPHVLLQQRVSPKLVRIAKLLWFLTSAVLYPSDGIIWNAAALARSRQLSQGRIQSELKKLANTESDRVAIHAAVAGNRAVAHSTGRVQKDRRVQ